MGWDKVQKENIYIGKNTESASLTSDRKKLHKMTFEKVEIKRERFFKRLLKNIEKFLSRLFGISNSRSLVSETFSV